MKKIVYKKYLVLLSHYEHFKWRILKSGSEFQINLQTLYVRTLVGSGVQGSDIVGGAQLTEQVISSPWDLCLVSSSLIAGTSPLEESDRDVLLIAMAGVHQIWALFLNKTTWWKGK
jgi:hypothetical protein